MISELWLGSPFLNSTYESLGLSEKRTGWYSRLLGPKWILWLFSSTRRRFYFATWSWKFQAFLEETNNTAKIIILFPEQSVCPLSGPDLLWSTWELEREVWKYCKINTIVFIKNFYAQITASTNFLLNLLLEILPILALLKLIQLILYITGCIAPSYHWLIGATPIDLTMSRCATLTDLKGTVSLRNMLKLDRDEGSRMEEIK